jgi:putative addiction module component (TIGR02574 family)
MPRPKMTDILELSIPERIQLVQDIWDTIADGPDSLELSDEQKAELDRRIEKLRADPNSALTWEEVRARIGL